MTRVGVYPGSFDPITKGHEDLIHRSLAFVDKLVVAVAVNVSKQPLFTLEERVALIEKTVRDKAIEVRSFDGLDRKSTRLNSSHTVISYAVFCLKKKPNLYWLDRKSTLLSCTH